MRAIHHTRPKALATLAAALGLTSFFAFARSDEARVGMQTTPQAHCGAPGSGCSTADALALGHSVSSPISTIDTPRLGVNARPLTPEERRASEVDHGLKVESVLGFARSAGVRPGDIILRADGAPTRSVSDLQAVAKQARESVALLIQRDGERIHLPIRIGEGASQ